MRGTSPLVPSWVRSCRSAHHRESCIRSNFGSERENSENGWSMYFDRLPRATNWLTEIKQRRADWQQNEQLAALVNHVEQPRELERRTLSD